MSQANSVITLVLAAGESRRYGDIKQIADIDGQPMLRRVLSNIISPAMYQVIVVLGAHADKILPAIEDLDMTICANHDWEEGISSSIRAGIAMIENEFPDADGCIVVLGDQWKLSKHEMHDLIDASAENSGKIVAADYDGKPGVPVYFPGDTWGDLRSLSGDKGASQLLQGRSDVILIELPNAAFDIDERQDSAK